MKNSKNYFIGLFIISTLLFVGCRENTKSKEKKTATTEKVSIDEFQLLTDYLKNHGDFINSSAIPAMINTKEVHENMDNELYKIIDLRKTDDFANGHIKNAINVSMKNLINYFENDITPSHYDKIAMVCYSGQSASYATSVMRLLGYENVYAMKYGMSSWNKETAKNIWLKHISSAYVDKLETASHPKPAKGLHPILTTGKTNAKDILKERAQFALNIPYKNLLVKAPELFDNSDNYFIINYWPKEKYDLGHVPGAVQYTPKKSLGIDTELLSLPINKELVTYCYTGQHAAFVTAYLKILGYDAKALAYGANSFMNSILKEKKWHAYSPKKIEGYELVKDKILVE